MKKIIVIIVLLLIILFGVGQFFTASNLPQTPAVSVSSSTGQ